MFVAGPVADDLRRAIGPSIRRRSCTTPRRAGPRSSSRTGARRSPGCPPCGSPTATGTFRGTWPTSSRGCSPTATRSGLRARVLGDAPAGTRSTRRGDPGERPVPATDVPPASGAARPIRRGDRRRRGERTLARVPPRGRARDPGRRRARALVPRERREQSQHPGPARELQHPGDGRPVRRGPRAVPAPVAGAGLQRALHEPGRAGPVPHGRLAPGRTREGGPEPRARRADRHPRARRHPEGLSAGEPRWRRVPGGGRLVPPARIVRSARRGRVGLRAGGGAPRGGAASARRGDRRADAGRPLRRRGHAVGAARRGPRRERRRRLVVARRGDGRRPAADRDPPVAGVRHRAVPPGPPGPRLVDGPRSTSRRPRAASCWPAPRSSRTTRTRRARRSSSSPRPRAARSGSSRSWRRRGRCGSGAASAT